MPRRSSPARTVRALSLSPLRICLSPLASLSPRDAQDGRIDGAAGIDGDQLATLHAFNIDEPQTVAGVDRHGDSPAAGHGVALFAGSEREDAGPLDGRRPRRSWPETLVAGKNHDALHFRWRAIG